jgi:hypothetical protein
MPSRSGSFAEDMSQTQTQPQSQDMHKSLSLESIPDATASADSAIVVQVAFQPGATKDPDARRRYLAWNEHGNLRLFISDSVGDKHKHDRGSSRHKHRSKVQPQQAVGRIEVEYSRERSRCAVREIRAPSGLSMGAIGPGICVLATAPNPSAAQPAKLIVHLATPWEKSSFEQTLPHGERVDALAVGRHFIAAFTSQRNLHVQTTTGVPIGVLALSGSPVCLAACEDLLLCISKHPGPEGVEPSLEYALYGVSAKERLAAGRVPLSPGSSLRWCGFSAEALPLALDSAGVLRALGLSGGTPLLAPASGDWLPVAELERKGGALWPVRAEAQSLYCAAIPKGHTEPKVGAVQRLESVRYHLPFGASTVAAESILRRRLLSAHLAFADTARLLPASALKVLRDGAGQRARNECSLLLKFFDVTMKEAKFDEAHDIAAHYFDAYPKQRERLLEDAVALARTAGQQDLAGRIASIVKQLSYVEEQVDASPPHSDEEDEEVGGEEDHDGAQHVEETSSVNSLSEAPVAPPLQPPAAPALSSDAPTIDPEVARRIAENRAKALARKAALATTKRLRSPSPDAGADRCHSLSGMAPAPVRLRAC